MSSFSPAPAPQQSSSALSPSSAPGPIHKLPPELIWRVLELTDDNRPRDNLSHFKATLFSASLVCKDWVAPAQSLLFRRMRVHLGRVDWLWLLTAIEAKIERDGLWICDKLVLESGSLHKAKHLIKYAHAIKHLVVQEVHSIDKDTDLAAFPALANATVTHESPPRTAESLADDAAFTAASRPQYVRR